MPTKSFNIIIPAEIKPYPKQHEQSAARILANYFKRDAVFQSTRSIFSADLSIGNKLWELKSPEGGGPNNIHKNLREAAHQSENIIIDLRRSRLEEKRAIGYMYGYLKHPNRIKRLLVILKNGKIASIL